MADKFSLEYEGAQFERWVNTVLAESDDATRNALRKVAFGLLSRIRDRTPVDTGRARAGWSPWLDANGFPVTDGPDPAAAAQGKSEGSFDQDLSGDEQYIEIVNGVPYIVRLEFGHSKQAPAGMVRIAMRELQSKMDDVALDALEDAIAAADRSAGY